MDLWVDNCDSKKVKNLKLSAEEWKHVKYIIALLYSFHHYIKALSVSKSCTVHQAWQIYNDLFQHLEDQLEEAECETKWKDVLITAINAAKNKFKKYYEETEGIKELLYAVAAVLNPHL